MKKYGKVEYPAHSMNELIHRECDICGKKTIRAEWDTGFYEINETEISVKIIQREGKAYPEGGWADTYDIDLCPKCFKKKLIPWLKSQGVKIKKENETL